MSRGDNSQAVHRIEFSVDWPPGHAVAYLIDGDEPILVDAGMVGETGSEELHDGLDAHGFSVDEIDHLLLTHPHADHVGQVEAVLEADPTVYAPAGIQAEFNRDIETVEANTRRNLRAAGVPSERLDDAVERLLWGHRTNRGALPLDAVDNWVEADSLVEIGGREFEPMYTPGHQRSHFCYGTEIGEEQVVFSGDMVVQPFRAAAIHANFDDGVEDGVTAFYEAFDRLESRSFDRVYPGHGPVHTEFETALSESIADLDDRVEQTLTDLGRFGAGTTALALADAQSDSESERARVLPEIVGVLSMLESRGEVQSWLDGDVRRFERC